MKCIFCPSEMETNSVEHIIPESLGNKKYIIEKGAVCDECNGRFSSFEKKALNNSILLMERAQNGVPSKKKKAPKGQLDKNWRIEGDSSFRKNFIGKNTGIK